MRKKTGLAGLARFAELAAMVRFMLLMESFQRSEIRDQRSEIRDQGSGIRDQGSWVRDRGSVELRSADYFHCPPTDHNYLQTVTNKSEGF
jgi:hypothetical protein